MKFKNLIFTTFLFIVISIPVFAQESGFGVGFKIGEPTGINGKYWYSSSNALDFTVGASVFKKNSSVHISISHLYHNYDLIKSQTEFPVYYGFGINILTSKVGSSAFGIKAIGGILWMSEDAELPIDIFFEAAPVFRLFPTTGLDLDVSFGARYFFK